MMADVVEVPEKVEKLVRVQMNLPERSYNRLRSLQARTEASSYAEVLRNSLRLYEALINESDKGGRVVLIKPGGEQVALFVPTA